MSNEFMTYHGRDSELLLEHGIREPVDLASGVAEDDGLSDAQGAVQVTQRVELPILPLDVNVELSDTWGQSGRFKEYTNRVKQKEKGYTSTTEELKPHAKENAQ